VALLGDWASNFGIDTEGNESITLDGETYRVSLALRYGFGSRFEAGLLIPFVGHTGGALDSSVARFHQAFGLPDGGREDVPRNRLLYEYQRDGREEFRIDNSGAGFGDLRLQAGVRLYDDGTAAPLLVALRTELKLPTGDSGSLRGSGSVDYSLYLAVSDSVQLGDWGQLTVFGAGGGMVMSKGEVLPDQQRSVAGFGMLGFGWSPMDWLALKAQVACNSPLYQGSSLPELGGDVTMVVTAGATFWLTPATSIDLGISEDPMVATASDVAYHLALIHRF
jgi:hypothetical protein